MTQREELPVSVKALDWEDYGDWCADCVVGRYWVEDVQGKWQTRFIGIKYETAEEEFIVRGTGFEVARDAAQADYEARILSAIVASPPAQADTFTYAVRVEGAYREGWLDRECEDYLDVDHGWNSSDTLRALTALASPPPPPQADDCDQTLLKSSLHTVQTDKEANDALMAFIQKQEALTRELVAALDAVNRANEVRGFWMSRSPIERLVTSALTKAKAAGYVE